MEMEDIGRGWTVYTEDGKRLGDVVEVHPHYLLVSRGLLIVRDVYVPRYAVAAVDNRQVHLAISEERIRHMGWTAPPPPPPPPVDSPAPRLVPALAPDAPEQDWPVPGEVAGTAPWPAADEEDVAAPYATAAADEHLAAEPVFDDYGDMGVMLGSSVEVDGDAYLAVRRLGDGPPLVFIHGWGMDRRIWDYLTLDLPHAYTVVTYDARGYGDSSAPWTGYDLAQASRDLRVLLRTLDLYDATLVGLDIGAAAALHYVLDGGRRAARLILIAPVAPAARADPAGALPEPLRTWHDDLRRDRPHLAAQLAAVWAPLVSPQTRAWLRDALLAAAPHALLHGLQTFAAPDLPAALGDVAVPTLVLHGRQDPVVPLARGAQIAAAIPGAHLVVLDVPGHLPMIADPERIVAQLRAALAGEHDQDHVPASAPAQEPTGSSPDDNAPA
jgi:pimeloyl-ACP methyl ester carboxylesterase